MDRQEYASNVVTCLPPANCIFRRSALHAGGRIPSPPSPPSPKPGLWFEGGLWFGCARLCETGCLWGRGSGHRSVKRHRLDRGQQYQTGSGSLTFSGSVTSRSSPVRGGRNVKRVVMVYDQPSPDDRRRGDVTYTNLPMERGGTGVGVVVYAFFMMLKRGPIREEMNVRCYGSVTRSWTVSSGVGFIFRRRHHQLDKARWT